MIFLIKLINILDFYFWQFSSLKPPTKRGPKLSVYSAFLALFCALQGVFFRAFWMFFCTPKRVIFWNFIHVAKAPIFHTLPQKERSKCKIFFNFYPPAFLKKTFLIAPHPPKTLFCKVKNCLFQTSTPK